MSRWAVLGSKVNQATTGRKRQTLVTLYLSADCFISQCKVTSQKCASPIYVLLVKEQPNVCIEIRVWLCLCKWCRAGRVREFSCRVKTHTVHTHTHTHERCRLKHQGRRAEMLHLLTTNTAASLNTRWHIQYSHTWKNIHKLNFGASKSNSVFVASLLLVMPTSVTFHNFLSPCS